jgi:CBS domain-containing protein
MQAKELMTTTVVTVTPETPVVEIAHRLASRGFCTVPVLVADVVRRLAGDTSARTSGWLSTILNRGSGAKADRYACLHGDRASDVMSDDLVTVEEETPVGDIAWIMEERRVERVPVRRGGRLAGIVSHADLLRLAFSAPLAGAEPASDERIRRAVEAAMCEEPSPVAYSVYPAVAARVVTFHGYCRSFSGPKARRLLAERVPGVKRVNLKLASLPPFILGVS